MHATVELQDDFSFNDDLLLDEDDRALAQRLYPAIYHALYHEELCQAFARIDPLANRAKQRSRSWGCAAVILVSIALLLAVSEPLDALYGPLCTSARCEQLPLILAAISGVCGIGGALIGTFGILHASQKRAWLENRLRTEAMRNFHFRTMFKLWDLLLTGRKEEYLRQREQQFAIFQHDVLRQVGRKLERIINNEDGGDAEAWYAAPLPPALSGAQIDKEVEEQWQEAYRRLRISGQIGYANEKLRNDTRLFSGLPRRQAAMFAGVAAFCVAGLILTHLGVAGDVIWGIAAHVHTERSKAVLTWMHVGGLWLAIVALGLKTLQEGLDPGREVERYRHYRAAMQALDKHFVAARSREERLAVVASVEHTATNEMLIFLRSGHEARFVM